MVGSKRYVVHENLRIEAVSSVGVRPTAAKRPHSPSLGHGCLAMALLLSLAMFAPLLGGGRVFLLDYADYPVGRILHVPQAVWAFPPGLTSRVPIQLALLAIFKLLPWGPVRLLPYLISPPLAAWGFRRLIQSGFGVIAATLLYTLSPFMYERMAAGQIYLVLGFALLPLFFSLVLVAGERLSAAIVCGLLLVLLIALSPHFIFIGGLILFVALVYRLALSGLKPALRLCAAFAVAAAICLYWVIPATASAHRLAEVSRGDLAVFRTASDPAMGLLINVAGLYGFWRRTVPLTKANLTGWPVFLLTIVAIVLVGAWESWRTDRARFVVLSVGTLAVIGFFMALGDRGPSHDLFLWLFDHFPGFRIMREPEKFLVLLTLAYAVFFGRGVSALVHEVGTFRARAVVAVILLALPCIYGLRSFWGFAGYVRASQYPASWSQADHLMGSGQGDILALPWQQYVSLPFAQDRVVANPMASFFQRDVLVNDSLELSSATSAMSTSRSRFISFLVRHGPEIHDIGNLLAPLDVRYILLASTGQPQNYSWLYSQQDLRLVHRWPGLTLFENLRQPTTLYATRKHLTVKDWGSVVGLSSRIRLTDYSITVTHPKPGVVTKPATPLGPRPGFTAISVHRSDPGLVDVRGRVPSDPVVLSLPYDHGWQYGTSHALANLGVTNMFPASSTPSRIISYGPWRRARDGYIVGGGALLVALALLSLTLMHEARRGRPAGVRSKVG
jgi:hypothetical protein